MKEIATNNLVNERAGKQIILFKNEAIIKKNLRK